MTGKSRDGDPPTSDDAAELVDSTRLEMQIRDALREANDGMTTWEIVRATGIPFESVTPRMTDMEDKRTAYRVQVGVRANGKPIWKTRITAGKRRNHIIWYMFRKTLFD